MTQISASVVRYSKSPHHKKSIATLSLVYPRFIHSEFMTHRVFSRNAMSSRAVPVAKMIDQVRNSPAMPMNWGANQPGMQADNELTLSEQVLAKDLWLQAAEGAATIASMMNSMGLHKQVVNRILEPFQWMHTVVTSTEWDNFFSLRLHKDAEPNIRVLAQRMLEVLDAATPTTRVIHAPFVRDLEMTALSPETIGLVSAARCARVSYLNHDGTTPNVHKDIELAHKLRESRHASPFEHVAFATEKDTDRSRNFRGWAQLREQLAL